MARTSSLFGVLLLSALALLAFRATNASALTLHECKGQIGTGKSYTDGTCSKENVEGAFRTVPITGEPELEATLTPTTAGGELTGGEEAGTHLVLHALVFGVSLQITCTGFNMPQAAIKNVDEEGVMQIAGTTHWRFTGCKVTGKFAGKCSVPGELETTNLKVSSGGDAVSFQPVEGQPLFTIAVLGTECPGPIAGERSLEGGTVGVSVSPTVLEFTSGGLTFGGFPAKFTAVTHLKTKGTEQLVALETP